MADETTHVGIENLKKAVKFSIDLVRQGIESGADGWQWTDFFSFVDEFSQTPALVKSSKEILAELLDLDEADRAALNAYIQVEFDIPNDKVEAVIEHSLAIAFSIVSLTQELK